MNTSSESESRDEICPTCKGSVSDGTKAVECEICLHWYHTTCQKVSDSLYKELSEEDSQCHWFCRHCEHGAKKLYTCVAKILGQQNEFQRQLEDINKKLKDLEEKAAATETLPTVKVKDKEEIQQAVKEEIEEKKDIESRKMNIVIHNLPETGNKQKDTEEVKNLFKDEFNLICNIQCEETTRLGKYIDERNRVLKITMPSMSDRKLVLRRAKELRNSNSELYSRIYIKPDLTKKQQEESKNLQAKLRQTRQENPTTNWTIRKGKIVEITLPPKSQG